MNIATKDPKIGLHFFIKHSKDIEYNDSAKFQSSVYNLLHQFQKNADLNRDAPVESLNKQYPGFKSMYQKLVSLKTFSKPDFTDNEQVDGIIRSVYAKGSKWNYVSRSLFNDTQYEGDCEQFWQNYSKQIKDYEINELIGPGAVIFYLKSLTPEKLDADLKSGKFSLKTEYESYNIGENKLNIKSFPLSIQSRFGTLDSVRLLIKLNAPLNEIDKAGKNALTYAIEGSNPCTAAYLINHGVEFQYNTNIRDKFIVNVKTMHDFNKERLDQIFYVILANCNIEKFKSLLGGISNEYTDFMKSVTDIDSLCSTYFDLKCNTEFKEKNLCQELAKKVHNIFAEMSTADNSTFMELIDEFKSYQTDFDRVESSYNYAVDGYSVAKDLYDSISVALEFAKNYDFEKFIFEINNNKIKMLNPIILSFIRLHRENKIDEAIKLLNFYKTKSIVDLPNYKKEYFRTEENQNLIKSIFENRRKVNIQEQKKYCNDCLKSFADYVCGEEKKVPQQNTADFNNEIEKKLINFQRKLAKLGFTQVSIFCGDANMTELITQSEYVSCLKMNIREIENHMIYCNVCHKNIPRFICSHCNAFLTCSKHKINDICPFCKETVQNPIHISSSRA